MLLNLIKQIALRCLALHSEFLIDDFEVVIYLAQDLSQPFIKKYMVFLKHFALFLYFLDAFDRLHFFLHFFYLFLELLLFAIYFVHFLYSAAAFIHFVFADYAFARIFYNRSVGLAYTHLLFIVFCYMVENWLL
jgi:hypothetical protein